MGATRDELLELADFWESRGDHAEATRLRGSAGEAGTVLDWTGQRSPAHAGLLDLRYTDKANVMHDGKLVGWVFALRDGYYRPSVDGIRGEDCATPDAAARKVVELHKEFRS